MVSQCLTALHKLQVVETHLRSLTNMAARKARLLRNQQLRIKQIEEQLTAKHDDILHCQAHANQLELDFKAREAGLNKLRTQLNAAKSNKEYSAILTQLNTERASNSKQEERILQELASVDDMKAAYAETEKQLAIEKENVTKAEAVFQGEQDKLNGQIKELQDQKDEVAASVPAKELSVFQRVADSNDGEALAQILDLNGGEYVCEGCNMSLPMEIVNMLMTREDIQICTTCGRILYIEEEVNKQQ